MRILVVEDDSVTRLALERLFKRRGFEVLAMSEGQTAYEILSHDDAPKIAIIDWALPSMSGLDLCRKLRELDRSNRTHVIMLTGKTGPEDAVAGLNAGADDYVRKPFDIDELYARVRAAARLIAVEDQLRLQADRDELTGVLSRSAILDELRRCLTHSSPVNAPLSIAMVDVDHFKQVNDQYGHGTGDVALRGVATLFGESVRPTDFVGRYGGEEFLIVLPGCDSHEAFQVAERIRKHTAGQEITTSAAPLKLTVSIGVSTATAITLNIDQLIDTADQALYRAKDAGRNRVVASTSEL